MTITIVGDSGASFTRLFANGPGSEETAALDEVTRPPDLIGPKGRAWLLDLSSLDKTRDGAIAHWVVEAPWAHPIWHSYAIVLVHLRELPNNKEHKIKFYLEDATHELWLAVLNPNIKREGNVLDYPINGAAWMRPLNFAAQFIEVSDECAVERILKTVHMIIDGKLSPDTDHQADWEKLYGNAMIKKEHRRT